MNFIKTSSDEMYKKLLDLGFTFLNKDGQFYCFINDGKQVFDNKDVLYTSILNG